MFKPIVTDRLILRRLMPDDAEPLFRYRSDPAVAQYQSWQPKSIEEARGFIDALATLEPNTPETWFQLAIAHRTTHELVGDCGLHFFASGQPQAEVGITVAPHHQRQGYATETLCAVLDFLFIELDMHRIFASIDPQNTASLVLFKRIGMRKEAHHIESLWHLDQWADDIIFAMLDREWPALSGRFCQHRPNCP